MVLIYMAVLGVIPGSPADKAGITRGSFISKINGTSITEQNALSLAKLLYPSAISADIVRLDWSEITTENGQFVVTPSSRALTSSRLLSAVIRSSTQRSRFRRRIPTCASPTWYTTSSI